jgi:hypothetical protein
MVHPVKHLETWQSVDPVCGMALEPTEKSPTATNTEYTCPMHPEIVQDHPGICSKCGLVLSPILAAAAMSFSSMSVIGNALRLKKKGFKQQHGLVNVTWSSYLLRGYTGKCTKKLF